MVSTLFGCPTSIISNIAAALCVAGHFLRGQSAADTIGRQTIVAGDFVVRTPVQETMSQ